MPAKIILGPILYIGRCDAATWKMFVNLLVDGGDPTTPPVEITSTDFQVGVPVVSSNFASEGLDEYVSWRWELTAARQAQEQWSSYTMAPKAGLAVAGMNQALTISDVAVPPRGELPRSMFFSCNGFDDPKLLGRVGEQDALWKRLQDLHLAGKIRPSLSSPGGCHLVIGGGDQVYADSLWMAKDCPLKKYGDDPLSADTAKIVTSTDAQKIIRSYINLYAERWGRKDPAWVFARIPSIFTWDDHDIFDGWGSYDIDRQGCDVFRKAFRAASLTFEAFQLGTSPQLGGAPSPHLRRAASHFMQTLNFDNADQEVILVLLDARNNRTLEQVLSDVQRSDLKAFLHELAAGDGSRHRHLIVISSIPVVYMRFDSALRLLELIPGSQDLEDDLRDHWESRRHRDERSKLIMNLLEAAHAAHCRVTILSGDVHIGARGRITSTRPEHLPANAAETTIEQITSSGIEYPPPSWLEFITVETSGTEAVDHIAPGVTTEVIPVSGRIKYLRDRNFLYIQPDLSGEEGRLWIKYYAEKTQIPEQITISSW